MPRSKAPDQFYRQTRVSAPAIVKPVTLQLPPAHPRQYEFITSFDRIPGCRFVIGACGTKFGKTYGSAIAMVREAFNNPDSTNWWVAPTYKQADNARSLVKRFLPPDSYYDKPSENRLILLRPDGSEHSYIEFKSGDNDDGLRGFGVHFVVIDEAARIPYDSYVSVITTLTQTMGRAIIISTPKGRGWFYDEYQKGEKFWEDGTPKYGPDEKDENAEYYSIRLPTWSNPWVKLEALRQMKKNLPEDVFRQEVAAQFLLESAGVFRGMRSCLRGALQEPQPGHRYVMGVDLGRLRDYSVLVVMDAAQRHVVYFDRFKDLAWEVQYKRIIEIARRYRAQVVMDSTGIGDPITAQIASAGIPVYPYKIGGTAAKQQLIDKLRVNIENHQISFPYIPVLMRELEAYEYQVTDRGVVRFSAPSGKHDDAVIALALAVWVVDQAPWVYRYRNERGI